MDEIKITITQLIWDDWNIDHIARHDIVPEEVELSLNDPDAIFLQAKQGRVMILGRAKKRLIAAVLNAQEIRGLYYVITARDMSKKERAFYRSRKEVKNE
jgi:uncharacterized protein